MIFTSVRADPAHTDFDEDDDYDDRAGTSVTTRTTGPADCNDGPGVFNGPPRGG